MEVVNCRSCGKMFNLMSNEKICPACKKRLEDKFQEVKEFLQDNPNSSVDFISKQMDVSVKQIRQWVREERLVFSPDSPGGIECESCGKMIHSGRFCETCKSNLADSFSNAYEKPKPAAPQKRKSDGNKMRFLQS